ncbi:MAG: hypothetical protein IKX36_11245 [Prevotella sp.]|nr:hypothetical protein [Prevotella sp.]
MKKVFAGLFIMMMGLFFVACSGGADLKGLIEKAKAEGANWTEAQWKDAFKEALSATKPMMQEMADLGKKAQDLMAKGDLEGVSKLQEEGEKITEKYKDLQAQVEEFGKIAESNEIGKKLSNDKAFQDELLKELGLDELKDMF